MYSLDRHRVYKVRQKFMLLFYHAVLGSIVRYGITTWYANLTVQLESDCWSGTIELSLQTVNQMDAENIV